VHEAFGELFWDERYRASHAVWSGKPNPQLVREAAALAPGAALDVGCGEGADALWLAARGWRVTAVDFSSVALERAAGHAAANLPADAASRIDWLHADLTEWAPDQGAFDLVSSQFTHLPREPRETLFRRLAAGVSPGGTLLLVGHDPTDLRTTVPRPPVPELFYTASEAAAALAPDDWDVLVVEARERSAKDPEGRSVAVHDAVLRARRHG
jgi:SAM-dependent methyltransferase